MLQYRHSASFIIIASQRIAELGDISFDVADSITNSFDIVIDGIDKISFGVALSITISFDSSSITTSTKKF
jgi:hypothetical protein